MKIDLTLLYIVGSALIVGSVVGGVASLPKNAFDVTSSDNLAASAVDDIVEDNSDYENLGAAIYYESHDRQPDFFADVVGGAFEAVGRMTGDLQ